MNEVQYLTDKGARKLEKRLSYLKPERLPQILEQVQDIVNECGGVDESPEYANIKIEHAFVETEIGRLELLLQSSQILNFAKFHDEVMLGSRVTILEKGSQEPEIYQLVCSAETNPRDGRISLESPLGHGLLGAKSETK